MDDFSSMMDDSSSMSSVAFGGNQAYEAPAPSYAKPVSYETTRGNLQHKCVVNYFQILVNLKKPQNGQY